MLIIFSKSRRAVQPRPDRVNETTIGKGALTDRIDLAIPSLVNQTYGPYAATELAAYDVMVYQLNADTLTATLQYSRDQSVWTDVDSYVFTGPSWIAGVSDLKPGWLRLVVLFSPSQGSADVAVRITTK